MSRSLPASHMVGRLCTFDLGRGRELCFEDSKAQIRIPIMALSIRLALEKLISSSLNFLICKMEISMPSNQSSCED